MYANTYINAHVNEECPCIDLCERQVQRASYPTFPSLGRVEAQLETRPTPNFSHGKKWFFRKYRLDSSQPSLMSWRRRCCCRRL